MITKGDWVTRKMWSAVLTNQETLIQFNIFNYIFAKQTTRLMWININNYSQFDEHEPVSYILVIFLSHAFSLWLLLWVQVVEGV